MKRLTTALALTITLTVIVLPAVAQQHWLPAGYGGAGLFPVMAVDPTDSNVVHTGCDVAGMYKSTDGGDSWRAISNGLASLEPASFAIDPANSQRLWLGTPLGLHRSTNGGASWTVVSDQIRCFKHANYSSIAVSPDGQTILVTSHEPVGDVDDSASAVFDSSVFRSTDGGGTWQVTAQYDTQRAPSVAIDPHSPSRAFLLVIGQGVLRSTDSGATWHDYSGGLAPGSSWKRIAVGRNVVWVSAEAPSLPGPPGLWKSPKDTASWTDVGASFPAEQDVGLAVGVPVQIHPDDDSTVFVGTQSWPHAFWRTTDGGSSWTGTPLPENYQFDVENNPQEAWADPYVDAIAIAVDPQNPDRIFYTTWWAVWRSEDGGDSFSEKIVGAQSTCATDLHTGDTTVLASQMDGGVVRSEDNGATWVTTYPDGPIAEDFWLHGWSVEAESGGDVYFTAGTTDGVKVYRSTNDGMTWTDRSNGLPSTGSAEDDTFAESSLAAVPGSSGTLFLEVDLFGVWKTTDAGGTWQQILDVEGENGPDEPVVKCIEVDPTNPSRVFLGTHWGGIQRSTNGGADWSPSQVPAGAAESSVQEIVALADGTVLAAFADGVYLSRDNGASFSRSFPVVDGLGEDEVEYVESIAVNPEDPMELFAATAKTWPVWHNRGSVWHSTDSGGSWSDITGDLPVKRVRDLSFRDGWLYAATWCAHVYRTEIGGEVEPPEPCVPSGTTMCLSEGRFALEVTWTDFQDNTGSAHVVDVGSDASGLFWFFDEANWEMLVKVLDACAINQHYWVFAAATTNVEYTLTVTDTGTGAVKTYFNPLGTSAAAITDSAAFATCP